MTFSILMSTALVVFFVLLVEPMLSVVRRRPRAMAGTSLLSAAAVAALASTTSTYTLSGSVVAGACLGVALAGVYHAAEVRRAHGDGSHRGRTQLR